MIYKFIDVTNDSLYDTCKVVIIGGPYVIFNNIVIDRLRQLSKGGLDELLEESSGEMLGDFDDDSSYSNSSSKISLDFKTFMEVCKSPPVMGKWFCSVDYSIMDKRQQDTLERYLKRPSEYGTLVVTISEYRDFRAYLNNRFLKSSKDCHFIQLSFPVRAILNQLVADKFKERGIELTNKAVELFILRMSSAYNDYETIMDKVVAERLGKDTENEDSVRKKMNGNNLLVLSHSDLAVNLKGIENYVLDDFLYQLTVPIKNEKIVTTRKIYRMTDAMLREYGARGLVKKLRYKIDDMIEMRTLINKGLVPVKIRYSVNECKVRIPEQNKMNKLGNYSFRRTAEIASMTSMRDWVFMRLILNNVSSRWDDLEYEKAVYALISRSAVNESRILNNIGAQDLLSGELYELNSTQYNESKLIGGRENGED